ncbi:MAG: exodeoxyribonuclease V subunit alpha [Deltaproteobacteria bacterium]|nr:exodeoxyribonuclease V subunit alpha [Deltaproteobacteria bacterium]
MSDWSLRACYEAGVVNALEMSAAESAGRLYGERREWALVAMALAQAATRVGHLALRLDRVAADFSPEVLRALLDASEGAAGGWLGGQEGRARADGLDWSRLPTGAEWRALLAASPAVWRAGAPPQRRPFVLDEGMLFTLRSWRGEADVADSLGALARAPVGALPSPERLFGRLFGPLGTAAAPGEGWFEPLAAGAEPWDRARLALYTALRGGVTVLHGGPGTGKTTLTQRVLAALYDQYDAPDGARPLRVALAAPTGKAAQRLTESIRARSPFFHLPEWIQGRLEGLQAHTLHALLGVAPGRATPQHHAGNPLPYDVVVVDESSMIDTWLMRSLVLALGAGEEAGVGGAPRLLLIGDPHQLPSVSAGAPFTELCGDRGGRSSGPWREELASFFESQGRACPEAPRGEGFVDRVVALNQVRRVSAESGVHAAAQLMQRVEEVGVEAVVACLTDDRYPDTALYAAPPFPAGLFEEVVAHYEAVVRAARVDPRLALGALKGLCVLCPHYGGPLGVHELNEAVEGRLRERRLGGWGRVYVGRPVLVTENHPGTGLVNGDVGVVGPRREVFFEGRERPVPYELLPPHRTVFAMSVHKSQGSEFQVVVLCLPPERSPILTRELIYTGLTRAKSRAVVVGSVETLRAGVAARVERGGRLGGRV